MVHAMTQAFPFAFRLYDKAAGKSKGELAIEMLSSLDVSRPVYVLMDSWYPSQSLVKACLKKGFHVIAMLKTNRILYPNGIAIDERPEAPQTCFTALRYPAPCCGAWAITCRLCGKGVVVTATGRQDDPRSVRVACQRKASAEAHR